MDINNFIKRLILEVKKKPLVALVVILPPAIFTFIVVNLIADQAISKKPHSKFTFVDEDEKSVMYLNNSNYKIVGNFISVQAFFNSKNVVGGSVATWVNLDCNDKRAFLVNRSVYTGFYGVGDRIKHEEIGEYFKFDNVSQKVCNLILK